MKPVVFELIFCSRNDSYALQDQRIPMFINYYSSLNCDEFRFCVTLVDWNAPPDRPSLLEQFEWHRIGHVDYISVPNERHHALDGGVGRKIYDYAGRNAGLASRAHPSNFKVIINQDVIVSADVFRRIITISRDTSSELFFRADRTDIDLGSSAYDAANVLAAPTARVNRRFVGWPISWLKRGDSGWLRFFERYHRPTGSVRQRTNSGSLRYRAVLKCASLLQGFGFLKSASLCDLYGVHGNGSGDFLVVTSKVADDAYLRYPETNTFYMHTDSYLLFKLLRRGFKQVIVLGEKAVCHAEHPRPDRTEGIPFAWHAERFLGIMNERIPSSEH